MLGALGMMVSIFIAASIIVIWRVGVDEEEEEGGAGAGREVAGYMVVLFVCLFVFNFAYGWG